MKQNILILSVLVLNSFSLAQSDPDRIASAQSVQLSSVDDAVQYAIKKNPDLEIYRQNQIQAGKDYNAVKNHWMPNLTASFSGVDNINLPVTRIPGEIFGQPGKTIEAEFGERYNYNAGLSISISILDFQSRFGAKIAKTNMELEKANTAAYKQKLAEQVAFYYYTAILTQKALDVQIEDMKAAQDVILLVEQKYEKGILDKFAVNLAKINRNNIQQQIKSYENILDQCHANLRILFGADSKSELVFDEKMDSGFSLPAVDRPAPDKGLEVYDLMMQQASLKLSQQKTNRLPKISITGYLGAQQYRDSFGISLKNSDWSDIAYISFNISLPIFNRFSTSNKVNSALIEYNKSRFVLEQEIVKATIEDDLMMKELNHSREAVEAAQNNYFLAEDNAGLQLQKFEQGLVSLDVYLDSFDDYLRTEAAYLNQLSELYSHYSKIVSRNY
jgi:outer membrane protein TolC